MRCLVLDTVRRIPRLPRRPRLEIETGWDCDDPACGCQESAAA